MQAQQAGGLKLLVFVKCANETSGPFSLQDFSPAAGAEEPLSQHNDLAQWWQKAEVCTKRTKSKQPH